MPSTNEEKAVLYDCLVHNSSVSVIILDKNRMILEVNQALEDFSGYTQAELIGQSTLIFYLSKSSYDRFYSIVSDEKDINKMHSFDYPFRHKDGHRIWGHVSGNPFRLKDKVLWTVTDITAIKNLEESLTSEKNYLQTLLDGIADPVMVIAPDYRITHMNEATKQNIKSEYIADLHEPKCYEVSHHRSSPCDGEEHPCPLAQVIESQKRATVVHTHPDPKGQPKQVELIANPFFDDNHRFQGIIETARDITEYIRTQEKLQEQTEVLSHQAHHDALTGLPNRLLFEDRLEQAIAHAKRFHNCVGVVFIDCDNFKNINDNLGHGVGDEVLRVIAQRMQLHLRFTDTCSRLGGDEFTLVLDNIKDKIDIVSCLDNLIAEVKKPLVIDTHSLDITLSIGVALYPLHGKTPELLLKKADAAMYISKEQGRDKITFFEEEGD